MKTERTLRIEYSDVLGDGSDHALLRLVARLDADLGYEAVRVPVGLASAIDSLAHQVGQSANSRAVRPRLLSDWILPGRAATIAAALIAMVLLMGIGYAAMPALERLYEAHTGTGAIVSHGLGRQVNLSRTGGGFTVTVNRVYADANQTAIGLTIGAPRGRTFNSIIPWGRFSEAPGHRVTQAPILTDNLGRELGGPGLGGEQGAVQNGRVAYLLIYDGTGISRIPKQLEARLTIAKLSAYELLDGHRGREVIVNGPFRFTLAIPVEPGRVADVRQAVVSGGTTVTLERVVTSPTGTRMLLEGAGPDALVQLTVDGKTYQLHPPDGQAVPNQWSAESRWEYVTGKSLQGERGEWMLTVRPGSPGTTRQPVGGPWVFHFTMP